MLDFCCWLWYTIINESEGERIIKQSEVLIMSYDYKENMVDDVLNYINNEVDLKDYDDLSDLMDVLNDRLWAEDSVTGNASGSYTFNRSTAQEYVESNKYLVQDVVDDGFAEAETLAQWWLDDNYEAIDVTIRCYLLNSAIEEALEDDDFLHQWEEAHKAEEE